MTTTTPNSDTDFDQVYFNNMQLESEIIDPNILIVEAGRAAGKTEGVLGPRTIRVAADLPGETSVLAHKTYVALLSTIVPDLLSYYNRPRGEKLQPLLREGVDYVVGEKKLPSHFAKPHYPILHAQHTICFADGHNLRLVSTDQPESIAGANVVHAFAEEMKHSDGEKIKTRIFPALRVSRLGARHTKAQQSHYYQGVTGISDTARISLGEKSWFYDYEEEVNPQLIAEIVTTALHVNEALLKLQLGEEVESMHRRLNKYRPILQQMRSAATMYIRASSFINRDSLGPKFFINQKKLMETYEFLTAICAIRERKVGNMFAANFKEEEHTFSDSYKYETILSLNLKDTFRINAEYLKYYDPDEPLELGFDPGSFASVVVAQPKRKANEYRVLKEFFVYSPQDLPDMAQAFNAFFPNRRNRIINLYYDRAANQRKKEKRSKETEAKEFKAELERFGWRVRLMNLSQRTIFHWEMYKLLLRLFSPDDRAIPKILIDSNECPNLVSAVQVSPIKDGSNPIELDKSSEVKLPLHKQAGLSTQIPSALFYLLWGKFERFAFTTSTVPRLPENSII